MTDPRRRFTDRVANYMRFRPGYPEALISALLTASQNVESKAIADIGAGTGIFTRLLLRRGARVYGVEPNASMRQAAEEYLAGYRSFISVDGDAEHTGLADASVDLVTAAQAFHWFDNEDSRAEFRRILKPGGSLALIWNKRRLAQPFQQEYDALLRELAPEYGKVNHMNLGEDEIALCFAAGQMQVMQFDNRQQLDFDGLIGRLESSSYCPATGSEAHIRLVEALSGLFALHAVDGWLAFEYDTLLYQGPIAS
jgi:ubiquinone/menaquinone biosynthesis C-methylase UbiE